jgi:four helix bundle protein
MADFRRLTVWQRAHALPLEVYRVTANLPAAERFAISDQIRRAAVSIGANIAEGYARGKRDFARYLNIALGSANELEYLLQLAGDLHFVDDATLTS